MKRGLNYGAPLCIRCGKRAADLDGAVDIPFRGRYCPPCAAIRADERARADIVQGPIVAKWDGHGAYPHYKNSK